MSKLKYTAGPWRYDSEVEVIFTPNGYIKIECVDGYGGKIDTQKWISDQEYTHNSYLISAAPELLEHLELQTEFLETTLEDVKSGTYEAVGKQILILAITKMIIISKRVIAKAKGEQ